MAESDFSKVHQQPQQRTFLDAHHPKFMYHPTKPPVRVYSQEEIDELGPEWSETYIHQEYPKCKYHWNRKTVTVKSLDEEVALGGGWADSPAAFDPYNGPRPARTDHQDPLKWVDDWQVPGLTAECRNKIKAQLLRADSAFWKSPDAASADLSSMKLGLAKVLFEAGILTEALLRNEIPALALDSAIAGGWYRFASETPERIFPERIGHYHVWRDEAKDWTGLFRPETAEWLAKLLEAPPQPSTPSDELSLPLETAEPAREKAALQDEKSGQKVLEGADSTATEVISNNDGLKFSSEQLRNEAVAAYVERWKCSEAALAASRQGASSRSKQMEVWSIAGRIGQGEADRRRSQKQHTTSSRFQAIGGSLRPSGSPSKIANVGAQLCQCANIERQRSGVQRSQSKCLIQQLLLGTCGGVGFSRSLAEQAGSSVWCEPFQNLYL